MMALMANGGALTLRPGVARPDTVRSTRADWAGQLSRGLPATRLPAVLSSLFSLCGHAHRRCAGLTVAAAQGQVPDLSWAARHDHALHTLRDHLRCVMLDWPRQVSSTPKAPGDAESLAARCAELLATCPLWRAGASDPAQVANWLEAHVTGMPLRDWLGAWEDDPVQATACWCEQASVELARQLRGAVGCDLSLPEVPALRVHRDTTTLRAWSEDLRHAGSAMTREPQWHGHCAETGLWTRVHERQPGRLRTPGLRLAARVAEIARLALPDQPGRAGAAWLDMGVLALGPGEAIAWLEMARGLLLHHVQLEAPDGDSRVQACHVVAPTEWNCHPDGALARLLERGMPSAATAGSAQGLGVVMAAYDPCIPYTLATTRPEEPAHA